MAGGTAEVAAFLAALAPAERAAEAQRLDAVFRGATGFAPHLAGGIVGYGRYAYTHASGRSGTSAAAGFAPRAREFALYVMPDLEGLDGILARLGRHRAGKGCLYVKRLADIDEAVLAELLAAGLARLRGLWPVTAG